ncbi:MAG: class I SAM-dependent methyltransferase [Spirochaetota bacterium]
MTYRHHFSEPLDRDLLNDAERKRGFNRKLFDVVALRYDVVTRLLSFGWDQRWKNRMIRRLGRREVRRIVDLATGTGDIARRLAAAYPGSEVVGVDLSEQMLRRARRLTRRLTGRASSDAAGVGHGVDSGRRADRVRFIPGDMNRLPFSDSSVDLVTGGYALRNAPDLDRALSEVRRVLRPGGRFAFLDFSHNGSSRLWLVGFWGRFWGLLLNGNPTTYGYIAASLAEYPSPEELRRRFGKAGFSRIRRIPLLFGTMELFEGWVPGRGA